MNEMFTNLGDRPLDENAQRAAQFKHKERESREHKGYSFLYEATNLLIGVGILVAVVGIGVWLS